jgi:hypothetical protein
MTSKSASPIAIEIELLDMKSALCSVVHEYKASIIKEDATHPFWPSTVKLAACEAYAQRISRCEDLITLRSEILTTPKVLVGLNQLIITEANRQIQLSPLLFKPAEITTKPGGNK